MSERLPVWFIPHGGGPCFFMDPPVGAPNAWTRMEAYLRGLLKGLKERPRAILIVSGHWLEPRATFGAAKAPPLIYDYQGFPRHTYELKFPAPGDPALARRARELLEKAGISAGEDAERGYDHGVFIPLLLVEPHADIPVVQLSLENSLDPARHLAIGRALEPLREEGVLIVGSGMSFHNLQNFYRADPRVLQLAEKFDAFLTDAVAQDEEARARALTKWEAAPGARVSQPHEDHLLPLMVAAGAAGSDAGARDFHDHVFGAPISGFRFG